MIFLAVADLKPKSSWTDAKFFGDGNGFGLTTREIIEFLNRHYKQKTSPGSYDDIRRKNLVYLVQAGIALRSADDPNANTNSPTRKYAISPDAAPLLNSYGGAQWDEVLSKSLKETGTLRDRLRRDRTMALVPVTLRNGKQLKLSPGPHNELQKQIIEEFLPKVRTRRGRPLRR